jgi:hypothetical protein
VPEEIFPVHLATCRLRGDAEMVVDVRSFERAWRLVLFFDRYIGRKIAEVTHIATYNRFVKRTPSDAMADDLLSWDYDTLFLPGAMQIIYDSSLDEDDEELLSDEQQKALDDDMFKKLDEPLPKVTKMPVRFYEKGIAHLKFLLNARQLVAGIASFEDKDLTMRDIFERVAEKLPPELVD